MWMVMGQGWGLAQEAHKDASGGVFVILFDSRRHCFSVLICRIMFEVMNTQRRIEKERRHAERVSELGKLGSAFDLPITALKTFFSIPMLIFLHKMTRKK